MIKQAWWFALLGTAIALVGGIVGPALGATGDFGWSSIGGTTSAVAGLPYFVAGDRATRGRGPLLSPAPSSV